jgi:hypothetical protein
MVETNVTHAQRAKSVLILEIWSVQLSERLGKHRLVDGDGIPHRVATRD